MAVRRGIVGIALAAALALPGCSAILSWSDSDLADAGPGDAGDAGLLPDGGDGGDAMTMLDGESGNDAATVVDAEVDTGIQCDTSNDSKGTATLIASPITVTADLCRFGDHDWYKFSRAIGGAPIDVRVTFDSRFGDVDLRLYNNLTMIGQSLNTSGNSDEVMQATAFGGTFYVEVFDDRELSRLPYTITFTY